MIVHITTRQEWQAAAGESEYRAASLQSDGFIHCSTVKQVVDTANLFFRGQNDLLLLIIDEKRLNTELKYEDPTGRGHDPGVGSLFPHVYGPVNRDAIRQVVEFPYRQDGTFALPDEVQKLI
ncbi:MAG: DUF952 domain-containing protein [Myxococcales bacterium]|nr:DUF952 domain-containing protein [Myxococcales bacterium]